MNNICLILKILLHKTIFCLPEGLENERTLLFGVKPNLTEQRHIKISV